MGWWVWLPLRASVSTRRAASQMLSAPRAAWAKRAVRVEPPRKIETAARKSG
jgi:hypothetical protein